MKKYLIFIPAVLLLVGGAGFLIWAQTDNFDTNYPSAREYAPNFWFDSEEDYYPTSPLDFYYDSDFNELAGMEARQSYDSLSKEEKLDNFKIFYKIDDSGNEIVYQYWLFYVFNNSNNEHYGDWESIFVFVDKNNLGADKIVASAHIGGTTKVVFANDQISNSKNKNIRILVEKGSHASCIDGDKDGIFNRFRDSENKSSYCFLAFFNWSQADKLHGLKVEHGSPYYDLRPISEIKDIFGKKYSEDRPLITKEKSPTLGMLPIKFGKNRFHALPLGGDPPQNAWNKKEFKNSNEVLPLTPSRLAGNIGGFFRDTATMIAGIGAKITSPFTNLFGAGVVDVDQPDVDETRPRQEVQSDDSELTVGLDVGGTAPTNDESIARGQPAPYPPTESRSDSGTPINDETTDVGDSTPALSEKFETEITFVSRVIDGDTVELQSGQKLRYIGINARELPDDCFAQEATQRNMELVENKQVILLSGPKDTDKYGRLLRFVWQDTNLNGKIDSGDIFVNRILIEGGYAYSFNFGEMHSYDQVFESAESVAKREHKGLWGDTCLPPEVPVEEGQPPQPIARKYESSSFYSPASINGNSDAGEQDGGPISSSTTVAIVINEIQISDAEFIELYNPTSNAVGLQSYYLSYYSSTRNAWNNPYRNKGFPEGASIPAGGHYLIGLAEYPTVSGNPNSDWQPYSSAQLNNLKGTIAVFSIDPTSVTSGAAYEKRADAVGWGSAEDIFLYEQSPVLIIPVSGESLTRDVNYADTNNNSNDFSVATSITPTNSNGETYSGSGESEGGGGGQGEEQDTTPPFAPTVSTQNNATFNAASDTNTEQSGNQISLSGTAEASSAITITQNPIYHAITTPEGNWSSEVTLQEGVNNFSITAKDTAGNISTSTLITINLDSITPTSTIAVANYAIDSSEFQIQWGSGAQDLSYYDVHYKIGQAGEWQDWITNTTSTSKDYTGATTNTYYFRARGVDTNQNTGVWQETSVQVDPYPIVINEIQVKDAEFVELYNPTSNAISLSGYYFSYYPSSRTDWTNPSRNKEFPSGASVSASSYYLIGLKDYRTSFGNPNADWQPYSSTQLSNSKGTIAVFPFDPEVATSSQYAYDNRVDAVGWDSDFDNDGNDISLYEQSPIEIPVSAGESFTRDTSYTDTHNNAGDFSLDNSPTPTNSVGETYDSNFSLMPVWQMYQKNGRHSGLASLAGPSWSNSSQATTSWTFSMDSTGSSQPVVDYLGAVYAMDGQGKVYAINTNGTQKWKFEPQVQGGDGTGWTDGSPALSSDSKRIYSTHSETGSPYTLSLYSIKATDGSLDWKYSPSESSYNQNFTSPVLDASGNIYVASKSRLYSVSPTGTLNWEKILSPSDINPNIRTPAISSDGYIYVSAAVSNNSGDRYIWKLDPADGSEVWKENPTGNKALFNGVSLNATGTIYTGGYLNIGTSGVFAIDPSDGSKIWSNNVGDSSSVVPNFDADGNIYIGRVEVMNSGALYKMNATGTLMWTMTPASPSSVRHPSVIDSQSRVYVSAMNKNVYALDSSDGSIIWQYTLSDEARGFAIGNGVVYVVTYDGKVYAF